MELNGLIWKRQKEDRKKKKERKEGIRTRQGFGELKTKMNCTEIFLLQIRGRSYFCTHTYNKYLVWFIYSHFPSFLHGCRSWWWSLRTRRLALFGLLHRFCCQHEYSIDDDFAKFANITLGGIALLSQQ